MANIWFAVQCLVVVESAALIALSLTDPSDRPMDLRIGAFCVGLIGVIGASASALHTIGAL